MSIMEEKYKIWCDGDTGPYTRGENPEFDKIVDELAADIVEEVRKGKFKPKDNTVASKR